MHASLIFSALDCASYPPLSENLVLENVLELGSDCVNERHPHLVTRARSIRYRPSVAWRQFMMRWRLSFQLFIHFMGFNTPGKILYMYYVLTNLHLLSLYQNTPSRWCFQGKGQVCFYLRQQVYILQKSSPKFKSGVSVKLKSSHEFQEAMSAKISILRLQGYSQQVDIMTPPLSLL